MSTDNSSKPADQPTSVSTPPEQETIEQVIEPVGSKPWDTPAPVAAEPDQQRGAGRESLRELSLFEKGVRVAVVLTVWNHYAGDAQNRFGADGRTRSSIHVPEIDRQPSQPGAGAKEIDRPPPNVTETHEPQMTGTDQPHTPEEQKAQPEHQRDHFDRSKNDPKPTYDKIRDNRLTWRQGHHRR
jgi:hypothetical protein